jgi:hypothetical protein
MIYELFEKPYQYSSFIADGFAEPFHFYWSPIIFLNNKKHFHVVFTNDESAPSGRNINLKTFLLHDVENLNNPPDKEYDLRSDEFLFVSKCKMRMVITLPCNILRDIPHRNLLTKTALVIPLFSLYYKEDIAPKYDPETIRRINACFYPQFFPFPKINGFPLGDSFGRIDLLTSVKKEYLKPVNIHKGYPRISEELSVFLIQWIYWYLDQKVSVEFKEAIDLFRSCI